MARTVIWTEAAVDDISGVAEFIARDSRFYAAALVRESRAAALSLRHFANRGRVVPEADSPAIHEIFIKHYRLIYLVTETNVHILAFVHGARDLAPLLDKLEPPK